ncbi:MAG: L,D-transpeptidase [Proteiniphilum sp.]|nr:L,D-transpeptidase [Proteiniphilum sp.]
MKRPGYQYILTFLSILPLLPYTGCKNGDIPKMEISVEVIDSIAPERKKKRKWTGVDIQLKKELEYDQYTLDDEYPYRDTTRHFQWEKIKEKIAQIENAVADGGNWGVLSNYKNQNGEAATITGFVRDEYKRVSDQFGVERYQSAPLYAASDEGELQRYGRDGWLVKIPDSDSTEMVRVQGVSFEGEYLVPNRYLQVWGDTIRIDKVVVVDVTHQHISLLEKRDDTWYILSMNPATTGMHKPPHAQETPTGIFAIQEKKEKMYYVRDGTSQIAGYAPYASRFTNGAYLHGVPVQLPRKSIIEYSVSLGTTPRSHMCVRNASSHSKFIYDRATVKESVLVVID